MRIDVSILETHGFYEDHTVSNDAVHYVRHLAMSESLRTTQSHVRRPTACETCIHHKVDLGATKSKSQVPRAASVIDGGPHAWSSRCLMWAKFLGHSRTATPGVLSAQAPQILPGAARTADPQKSSENASAVRATRSVICEDGAEKTQSSATSLTDQGLYSLSHIW